MSTHNYEPEDRKPDREQQEQPDVSLGYERSDVRVTGIVVFLTALSIFVAVVGVLAWGMGKLINAYLNKEDGPANRWARTVDVRQLGNMPASPDLQRKVAELTQTFPTPRVQTDDGNQDVADLHRHEDLLLDNYSWVDRSQGKVRIPIERAMELVAQRGLAIAPPERQTVLMFGDKQPQIEMPLTNGFARTSYEQEQNAVAAAETGKKQ